MDVTQSVDLPSPTGFALILTYRLLRHQMDAALRDVGLTTPQWGALSCLDRSGELSGAEIARIHCTTPQTMHTIVLNLEQAGLVVREPDPHHGHVLLVRLSEEGRAVLERASARVAGVDRRLCEALRPEEVAQLQSLLQRCMLALAPGGEDGD